MKLSLANLNELRKKVQCLDYDVEKLRKNSLQDPQWVAFGSGNIFRGYIARVIEDTIKYGFDRGISVVETFDEEIIDKIYTPYDNLSLSVTLDKDGDFSTRLICNLAECNLTHKIRKSGLGGKRRKRTKISVKNVENNEKKMKKKCKKASRFG